MSATPRTDEAVRKCHGMHTDLFDVSQPLRCVYATFARQLETELAQTNGAFERCVADGAALLNELATERQKRERAEADAAVMRQATAKLLAELGHIPARDFTEYLDEAFAGAANAIESTTAGAELLERLRKADERIEAELTRGKQWCADFIAMRKERDSLRAEVARLREDKAIVDWLCDSKKVYRVTIQRQPDGAQIVDHFGLKVRDELNEARKEQHEA